MDLIYTDSNGADVGVLSAYSFDMSFGASENDFELTVESKDANIEDGAFIYIEGTEYGGIIDGIKASTNSETVTYRGRTWHGILNSKVITPDEGDDYLIVEGPVQIVLSNLISRLGLADLFEVDSYAYGMNIYNYSFNRYCKAYDGIRGMLSPILSILKMKWKNNKVLISITPRYDYSRFSVDGEVGTLKVERTGNKVNHLICLGRGELAEREVIHLYANASGNIVDNQHYFGLDEICDVYDYSNAESSEDLRKGGIERFKELMNGDKAEVSLNDTSGLSYEIGDIIGATEYKTGITVKETVTQKIVKIDNGTIKIEYKTGG